MIPVTWIVGAVGVAVAALGGYRVGAGLTEAKYLKAAQARQGTVEKQRYKRAKVVTQVISSPVREKVIREVIENPVFRDASCDVGPSGVQFANQALTGRDRPAGNSELPAGNGDH